MQTGSIYHEVVRDLHLDPGHISVTKLMHKLATDFSLPASVIPDRYLDPHEDEVTIGVSEVEDEVPVVEATEVIEPPVTGSGLISPVGLITFT